MDRDDVVWEAPPERALRLNQNGRYVEFAELLRDNENEWAIFPPKPDGGERTLASAAGLAQTVRRGKVRGFTPQGAFEAVANGTKVHVRYVGKREVKAAPPKTGPDPVKVREWARTNGFNVNPRGALPAEVTSAYVRAHAHLRSIPRGSDAPDA